MDNSEPVQWKVSYTIQLICYLILYMYITYTYTHVYTTYVDQVRKLTDEVCTVPALIVLIPGPDGTILESAQRLRHQFLYTCKLCFKIIQHYATQYFNNYLCKHKPDQVFMLFEFKKIYIILYVS